MTKICAWCRKVIKQDLDDPRVSHSMCDKCKEKAREEVEEAIREYLNTHTPPLGA